MTASNIATIQAKTQTMSSREIAGLTEKQHQHVKRDIENMLVELEEDASKFGHIYLDAMNREQTEYLLDRELTETLLTGYSAILRRRVVRRLRELEDGEIARALTNAEIKRIEQEYRENGKHHPNFELGEKLKTALAMEDDSQAVRVDRMLEKMDFSTASRVTGLPEGCLRRNMAEEVIATTRLMHIERGEHEHPDPVRDVVMLGTLMVRSDKAKANLLEYQAAIRKQPLTLADIDREDRKQGIPTPRAKSARKRKV